jgi:hypothetical protein
MPPIHYIVIKSHDGEGLAVLTGVADTGFMRLSSAVQVNAAGMLTFSMLATNPIIALLTDDTQVEHWWNQTLFFRGLFQHPGQYMVDERDSEIFTATCYGEKDLLNRSVVAWKAGTQNLALFENMAAESILHTLVRYNATLDATVENGRLVTYPENRISVEDDLGRGAMITPGDLAGKSLLEALQQVATMGGVDFDLIRTGPKSWVFRVYAGQRGVDRTQSVVFGRTRRNVSSMAYNDTPQDPRTVAIIAGNGEGADRAFAVRYGPDYNAANHREVFASQISEVGGEAIIQAEGDRLLDEKRLRPSLNFTPLQRAGVRFGTDYNVGDLVSAVYRTVNATFKVIGATVSVVAGSPEQVVVEFKQLSQ